MFRSKLREKAKCLLLSLGDNPQRVTWPLQRVSQRRGQCCVARCYFPQPRPPTPIPHPLIPLTVGLGSKQQQSIFRKAFHHSDQLLVGNPEFPLTDECVFLPGAVCTTSAVERGLVFCKEPASNQLNNSGNWTLKDQVGQWRQLNLSHITNITAIGTQAGHLQPRWWRKQYLLYSSCDGEYWRPYEKVRGIFHVFSRLCYCQQSTHQK